MPTEIYQTNEGICSLLGTDWNRNRKSHNTRNHLCPWHTDLRSIFSQKGCPLRDPSPCTLLGLQRVGVGSQWSQSWDMDNIVTPSHHNTLYRSLFVIYNNNNRHYYYYYYYYQQQQHHSYNLLYLLQEPDIISPHYCDFSFYNGKLSERQ